MKKFLFAVAFALSFYATSNGQTPVVATGGGNCGQNVVAPQSGPYMPAYGYGYAAPPKAGFFQRLFKKNLPTNTLPAAQGGQLAFPVNPFVRSPRDFFMMD
jgi:hypothetical protein